MGSKKNRKFIRSTSIGSNLPNDKGKVYLVYLYDSNKLSSEGPFKDQESAHLNMHKLLLDGKCAWVVSYNG